MNSTRYRILRIDKQYSNEAEKMTVRHNATFRVCSHENAHFILLAEQEYELNLLDTMYLYALAVNRTVEEDGIDKVDDGSALYQHVTSITFPVSRIYWRLSIY